jgi:hypothetical protein
MASVRRHLASLGLVVVLCHVLMQVLVPAALCCQKPLKGGASAEAHECCTAGAHPGQTCPMHSKRSAVQSSADPNCSAKPMADLHDIFMTLSAGGVLPTLVALQAPAGSESAPSFIHPFAVPVAYAPLGPPPRA